MTHFFYYTINLQTMDLLRIYERDVLARQATHCIGTLGHVSEGKSTLIRALTGVKTQRHQKEQVRNITIHLGYANCKIYQHRETGTLVAQKTSDPAPDDSILVAHLSFVDCPGHEAFLATMLGGASIMDSACFVIAANQEVIPQPQTYEHLVAADMLGLQRITILQNKLDLITKEEAVANEAKIRAFTAETVAESAPLYPICAQHGWNIQEVLEHLLAQPPPERNLQGDLAMTCVRSFDCNKPSQWIPGSSALTGGIIGGTLSQGVCVVGDWIELRPGFLDSSGKVHPIITQITGLRCEETSLPYAVPGSLIAIETTMDPGLTAANRCVGQRIGFVGCLPPIVSEITVKFKRFKRDQHSFKNAKEGDIVRVCANVMTVEGVIVEVPEKKIRRIQLKRPLCLAKGEMVSIMRMNKDAGRELLEGCGKVTAIRQWTSIAEPPSGSYPVPSRLIKWIPQDASEFQVPPYSYGSLLDALYERKSAELETNENANKIKIKEPVLGKIPKHTIWVNWAQTVEALGDKTYAEHFQTWVCKELSTEASVNGTGQLVLRGMWKLLTVCNLVRKYIKYYKKCKQCQGIDTKLVRVGKIDKVWCDRCKTDSFVDA